jgi:hypothetical protein
MQAANELSAIRQTQMAEFFSEMNRRNLAASPRVRDAIVRMYSLAPDANLADEKVIGDMTTIYGASPEGLGRLMTDINEMRKASMQAQRRTSRLLLTPDQAVQRIPPNFPESTRRQLETQIRALADPQGNIDPLNLDQLIRETGDVLQQQALSQRADTRLDTARANSETQQFRAWVDLTRLMDQREKVMIDIARMNREAALGEVDIDTFTGIVQKMWAAGIDERAVPKEHATALAEAQPVASLAHSIFVSDPLSNNVLSSIGEAARLLGAIPPKMEPGRWESILRSSEEAREQFLQQIQAPTFQPFQFPQPQFQPPPQRGGAGPVGEGGAGLQTTTQEAPPSATGAGAPPPGPPAPGPASLQAYKDAINQAADEEGNVSVRKVREIIGPDFDRELLDRAFEELTGAQTTKTR